MDRRISTINISIDKIPINLQNSNSRYRKYERVIDIDKLLTVYTHHCIKRIYHKERTF